MLVRVRVIVAVRDGASGGTGRKVVLGDTVGEAVVVVLEVGDKLLALAVGRRDRRRTLEGLFDKVVVHVAAVGRKVDGLHTRVEAV